MLRRPWTGRKVRDVPGGVVAEQGRGGRLPADGRDRLPPARVLVEEHVPPVDGLPVEGDPLTGGRHCPPDRRPAGAADRRVRRLGAWVRSGRGGSLVTGRNLLVRPRFGLGCGLGLRVGFGGAAALY